MAGITAFRETYMASDTMNDYADFNSFDARQMRYRIFWSFYESNAYRNAHKWAASLREQYGLYRYIRNIYNPSFRLAEFWRAHLLAGALDPQAGDGIRVPSALPIITENERLRPALATLWRSSNWQRNKDTLSLWGTILGDAVLRVNDDPRKGRVYMTLTHPGTIKDLDKDEWGNIKGYVIQENWQNPNGGANTVIYEERAYRDGINVVYDLYLDGRPYNIHENEIGKLVNWWTVPYGFIPMVAIQHNNVGLDYGFSELHSDLAKFREADDMASKLDDQIRKLVEAPWLMSGVANPKTTIKTNTTSQSEESDEERRRKESARQEIPILYGPVGATATPLVAPLDIAATSDHIGTILKDIERDYPELTVDLNQATGDISGKALRIHRQPVEDKVVQRRGNYDDAIMKAQQMAIAIGGFQGYPGYEGFNLDSYAKGDLEHTIGDRPVFRKDETDDFEMKTAFYTAVRAAKDAGIPVEMVLEDMGWDEKKMARFKESPEYQAKIAGMESIKKMASSVPDKTAAVDRQNNNQNTGNTA